MPNPQQSDEKTLEFPRGKGQTETTPPTESAISETLPGHVPGYDLLAEVGRGGMGVVYKAHHLHLNRVVALKMILAGTHAGPMELVRFRQEAETVARLQHPNIVQIHEVGAHAGLSYLALEYVEGGSLAQRTAGIPQPPRDAAHLVELLARAVDYAHQNGILHRDLTPGNVLLTAGGAPKLTDFGLARRLGDTQGMTATGAIVGTPGYLAPEQASASKIDLSPATDVFALGAILYNMLTGRPPFQAATTLETILHTVEREPVRPTQLQPTTPPDLETICLKCLQKDPARRYVTAADLADDLRRFLADEPIRARPVGQLERFGRWCRRNPGIASLTGLTALLLLVIAAGGVALSLQRSAALGQAEKDRDAARRAEREGKEKLLQSLVSEAKASRHSRQIGQRFATLEAIRKATALARELDKSPAAFDELRNLAIAALALPDLGPTAEWASDPDEPGWTYFTRGCNPDWRWHAVSDKQTGVVSLRRIGTGPDDVGELARFPGFGGEVEVESGPDGRFLGVRHWQRGERLQVWRVDGSKPVLALEEPSGCAAFGLGPDARLVSIHRDGKMRVYDLQTGRPERSFPTPLGGFRHVVHHPRLPRVAVTIPAGVVILDVNTGQTVGRLPMTMHPFHVAWHPHGNLLAAATNDYVRVWDVPRERQNWALEHRGGGLRVAFNSAGDLLASSGWTERLRFWNPYTGQEVFGTSGRVYPWFGAGDRLATAFPGRSRGEPGPLVAVEVGREYRTLVAGVGRAPPLRDYLGCGLHPDGRLLAVAARQGVSLMDLHTGTEQWFVPTLTTYTAFEPGGALLTRHATALYRWPVTVDPTAPDQVRVGPPERVPIALTSTDGMTAHSADGAVLAVSAGDGAVVWQRDRPQAAVRLRPHGDCRTVAVSPDGTLVATGAHNGTGLKVWDARTGEPVREFLLDTPWTVPLFSPDGRWLVNKGGQSWKVSDWSEGPRYPGGVLAFAPDSRLAAWSTQKGFVHLIETETGRELARLEDPQQDGFRSLTFSPNGTQLIGVTNDSFCVRVWDLRKIRRGLVALNLDWDADPYQEEPQPADRPGPEPLQVQVVGADRLPGPAKPSAVSLNNQAWQLVTGPANQRDPARALPLARQAVELSSDNPVHLNTLGVVLYRNDQFKDAIAALEKSLHLGKSQYDGWNLFFLAMCHAKLGDAAKARDHFDRAVRWVEGQMELSPKHASELAEFRAEAESAVKRLQKGEK